MCAIEVIRREKKKNKKLQAELEKKKDTQELEQMITRLKVQIEEDKRIEEALKEQLEEGQDHWKLGSRDCHTKKGYSKQKYAK
jgi:excinuclease UvrABC ATPase subunit